MREVNTRPGSDDNMTWPDNTESWLTPVQMHLVGDCRMRIERKWSVAALPVRTVVVRRFDFDRDATNADEVIDELR
ncbi:MAG: hypothetical protein AB7O44_25815 [Hyphomicrobiaceae bacterium]